MSKKIWASMLLPVAILAISCNGQKGEIQSPEVDSLAIDTAEVEELSEVEEEIQMADEAHRLDGSFDDFLFAFTHSHKLQSQRICFPLSLTTVDGEEQQLTSFDGASEFAFLEGDFYTVMYGEGSQIEEEKANQDSLITVERIDLGNQQVRSYEFARIDGHWRLTALADRDFASTGLQDFLTFYAKFSTDSVFQNASLANPLKMAILDPDDDESYIEGTIDADQWSSFCSEVPSGVISNIHYGQRYDNHQLVLQKCGSGSGMQELFTFKKDASGWRLTSYEN